MKKTMIWLSFVCVSCVALGYWVWVPSATQHNGLVHCSPTTASVWFDIGGVGELHPYSGARGSFDSIQEFGTSCGVDLERLHSGEFPLPDFNCEVPDAEDWYGASVLYRLEDHGDWYRGFIVRTSNSGVEVLSCGGIM